MINAKGGIGIPGLIAILVATLAFWIAVYFLAVPAVAAASGVSEPLVTLITAAIALAVSIPAMRMGKARAARQAAENKNV